LAIFSVKVNNYIGGKSAKSDDGQDAATTSASAHMATLAPYTELRLPEIHVNCTGFVRCCSQHQSISGGRRKGLRLLHVFSRIYFMSYLYFLKPLSGKFGQITAGVYDLMMVSAHQYKVSKPMSFLLGLIRIESRTTSILSVNMAHIREDSPCQHINNRRVTAWKSAPIHR